MQAGRVPGASSTSVAGFIWPFFVSLHLQNALRSPAGKKTKQNQHTLQVWSMCCSPEMCVVFGSVKFSLPCWKSGFTCKKIPQLGHTSLNQKVGTALHVETCISNISHFLQDSECSELGEHCHGTALVYVYLLRKCPELYSVWWDVSLPVAGGWSWMSFKVPSNPNHLKKYLSSCFLSFFSWIFRQDCETKDTFCFIFKAKLTLSELEGQQAGRALKFGINLQASL